MDGWGRGPWRPGGGGLGAEGADPAPGDPGHVRALAAGARRCAAVVDEQADRLAALDVATWRGAAAGAFAAWLPAAAGDLRRSATALSSVAGELEGYAAALAAAQAHVRALGQRAEVAAARADRARAELARAGDADPWGAPEGRFAETVRALADRDAAEGELRALRREAQRVGEELVEAGRVAARGVLEACEGLPTPPALGALVGPVAAACSPVGEDGLGDALREVVQDHEETIRTAADVVAVVGTVAAVATLVLPPAAIVAGVVATTATVVGASLKGALVAGTEAEVNSLWPEALALGTLGASRLVTAPVRFAPGLAPYTVSGSRAVSLGQPVSTRLRDMPSIWDHGATMGSRELVARSVGYAVQTPAQVAGAVGGVQGGRNLWQRYGPGERGAQPQPRGAGPQARSEDRQGQPRQGQPRPEPAA